MGTEITAAIRGAIGSGSLRLFLRRALPHVLRLDLGSEALTTQLLLERVLPQPLRLRLRLGPFRGFLLRAAILPLNLAAPYSFRFLFRLRSRFGGLLALRLGPERIELCLFSDALCVISKEVNVEEAFLNKEENQARDQRKNYVPYQRGAPDARNLPHVDPRDERFKSRF